MDTVTLYDCSPECLEYMGYEHHEDCKPVKYVRLNENECPYCHQSPCRGRQGYDINCDGSSRLRDSLG